MFFVRPEIKVVVSLSQFLTTSEILKMFSQFCKKSVQIIFFFISSDFFLDGLKETTMALYNNKKKADDAKSGPVEIILNFKRYIYDPNKKIVQS